MPSIVWGRDGPYRKFSHPRYLPRIWLLYAISRRQILGIQEVGDAGGRHVQGRVWPENMLFSKWVTVPNLVVLIQNGIDVSKGPKKNWER